EDGIRDFHVTGVQTCALPILDRDAHGRSGDGADRPAHHAHPPLPARARRGVPDVLRGGNLLADARRARLAARHALPQRARSTRRGPSAAAHAEGLRAGTALRHASRPIRAARGLIIARRTRPPPYLPFTTSATSSITCCATFPGASIVSRGVDGFSPATNRWSRPG